jgi:hypothetical protein
MRRFVLVSLGLLVLLLGASCDPDPDPGPDPGPSETEIVNPPEPPPPASDTDLSSLPELTDAEPNRLPEPGVIGGGPLLGGDPEAVARIKAQLPDSPSDFQFVDSAAVTYAKQLVSVIPSVGPAFSAVEQLVDCGTDYGVLAAKAYVARDYRAGGAVVILSADRLSNLPQIALSCFADRLVSGGGFGGLSPCITRYSYVSVYEGFEDRYYVLVAGTHQPVCDWLASTHRDYAPTDW